MTEWGNEEKQSLIWWVFITEQQKEYIKVTQSSREEINQG